MIVTLSHADRVAIGSEIAGYLLFDEWTAPPDGVVRITLDEESIQAIVDELATRLII